jgi:Zinc knuckle.
MEVAREMSSVTTPVEGGHAQGRSDRTTQKTSRRITLLERADLDSDDDEDEQEHLLSSAEYDKMIKENPKQFLQEIRELIQQQRALNVAYADTLEENKDLKERVTHLEDKIKRKDGTIARLTEEALEGGRGRSQTPGSDHQKLGKITDPPFFANNPEEDKLGFDGWLTQVKKKLGNDGHLYPTEGRKIVYVTGLLRSPAYELISPRLDDDNPQAYTTVIELYKHMVELWSNPNKQKDARALFRKLTMDKTEKFQDFYAEFTRLVAEGHISQQDLKDELNTKLWWKLQEAVMVYYNDNSYDLHQFATMCATIDRQIRERLEKAPQFTKKPKASGPSKDKDTKPDQKDRAPAQEAPGGSGGRRVGQDRGPMVCYNCKKPGHIARKCTEPTTEERKQYLAAVAKEQLKVANDSAEGSGNDDL